MTSPGRRPSKQSNPAARPKILGGRRAIAALLLADSSCWADRRSTAWGWESLGAIAGDGAAGHGVDAVALLAAQEALDPHAFRAEQEYVPSAVSRLLLSFLF